MRNFMPRIHSSYRAVSAALIWRQSTHSLLSIFFAVGLLVAIGGFVLQIAGTATTEPRGHLWGEQHRIETRTKRNHSWVNSGCLTIGGNYSRSPNAIWAKAVLRKARIRNLPNVR